ncbi:hypothetical protein ACFFRR_010840 [Megaselia abdita]
MSFPMNNVNSGGYAPPGFGAGYPPPNAPPAESGGGGGYAPPPMMGFQPPQGGGYAPPGYNPVPQNPPFGGQSPYPPGGGSPYPPGAGSPYPPGGGAQYPPGAGSPYPPGGGSPYPPGGQPYAPPGQPPYGQPQQPIITQPGAAGPGFPGGDWMSMPAGIPNCPRGLEYLTTIDQLLVKQKVELLEAFTGFETNNKFSIKNSLGQKVYYAVEDTDCCTRNMCGPLRPFDMKILDNYKNEVIHLNRPLACDSCCFPCCLQSMEVTAPPGNLIGSIEQEWSICSPSFKIKNHSGETVLRIEGPFCTFSLCGDVEFQVKLF